MRRNLLQKVAASAMSIALAATMSAAVPGAAFASYDADSSSITAKAASATVAAGDTLAMSDYFTWVANGGDGAYHVDYKITSGSKYASVNKHSGVLTATAEGTTTVTAYLTGIAQPSGNSSNPCDVADLSASITVSVTAAGEEYGYQGVSTAIKMTDPTVVSFSGSNDAGWVNQLGTISAAADGYYYFTVAMTSGFKNYNTASAFAGLNAGNIELQKNNGTVIASLSADNDTAVSIYSVDNATKTIVVKVDVSGLGSSNNAKLVFGSGFHGNNAKNTLGTTVTFAFSR